MTHYRHRKISLLRIVSMILRKLGGLISIWPLLLIAALVISPVGPHLRVQYTYELRGTHRQMIDCEYLGARGFTKYIRYGECPVIVVLDTRAAR